MLLFVTGVAGTGKSTLTRAIAARGIEAHDGDDGIARHVRISDRTAVSTPPRAKQDPEWIAGHEFRFEIARVSELAARATPKAPVVLLGSAYGDDEVIALANRSWYLDVEEGELRRRLAVRDANSYGHAPHEIDAILSWHAAAAERYEGLGATRLDATRPVDQLADEILGPVRARDIS